MVKVKLIFYAQFCGYAEQVVELPDADPETIKAIFPKYIGIPFDDNCDYEILD
jgi:hypothetical protein